jgi:thiamine-phosphate pyrophosphorylase
MSETKPRLLDFTDVALYAITPESSDKEFLLTSTEKLLKGGVDAVQLRNRSLTDRDLLDLGKKLKALCVEHGALFLVNNRVDVALATDADGLHLGHEDLPVSFARGLLGHRKIIGMSTHSLPEALAAQKQSVDYVSCGPIWATPTKPDYKAVGINLVNLYNAALRVPFVVIGGVDEKNIDDVVATGAKTVAVVRALYNTTAPEYTARQFKEKILNNRKAVHSL